MSTGDFRDGSGLSFTPAAQSTRAWARALGAVLIVGALAFAAWSAADDRAAYPALAGANAPGTLSPSTTEADGVHLAVTFALTSGESVVATSLKPVTEATAVEDGRAYKVHYLPKRPSTTFIEGIDEVQVDSARLGAAGAIALVGLLILARPFKVRRRQPRRRPEGRHCN